MAATILIPWNCDSVCLGDQSSPADGWVYTKGSAQEALDGLLRAGSIEIPLADVLGR